MDATKRQEILTHCRYLLESYDKETMHQAYAALLKIKLDAVVCTAKKPEIKNDIEQKTKNVVVEYSNTIDDDCNWPPVLPFTSTRDGNSAEGQKTSAETTKSVKKRGPKRHKNDLQNDKAGNA